MTRAYRNESDAELTDMERADHATDAANAIGWAIVETPSTQLSQTAAQRYAYAMRAASLMNKRDAAMGDPKKFIETLFQTLSDCVDDLEYDVRMEHLPAKKRDEEE